MTLSSLVLDPPHSLVRQSFAPVDMRGGGTINADGFGIGWYPDPDPDPDPAPHRDAVRYRSASPIWSDAAFAALAGTIRSSAVLAAVRSATSGMPVTAAANAPFAEGRWLFSHNGTVRGWPGSMAALAATLPVTDLMTLDAPTDAALLWALVRHRLRRGEDPEETLSGVVTVAAATAPGSRLNLLLTDGTGIWATAWGHALSVRTTDQIALVASEPTDQLPTWTEVPDRHLVMARPGHRHIAAFTTTGNR